MVKKIYFLFGLENSDVRQNCGRLRILNNDIALEACYIANLKYLLIFIKTIPARFTNKLKHGRG
jgi:hypothetical protein